MSEDHKHDGTCKQSVCPTCGCCMYEYTEPCGKGCDPDRCGCPDNDADLEEQQ